MLDIELRRHANRTPCGAPRRDFLRVGGLGTLSAASLLSAQAAAGTARPARAKSVILVFLGGGLSHHDSFDPKPEAPSDIRGNYKPIATKLPGVQFSEMVPKLAQRLDKLTLVRSGSHSNDHHETATNWVLSGRFGSPFGDYPAIGAVVSQQLGYRNVLPPYVAVPQNPSFTWELGKSAFLGGRFESFRAGDPHQKDYRVQDLSPAAAVGAASAARRKNLLDAVDRLAKEVEGSDQLATYDEFRARASAMVLSGEARSAFAIDQEPAALRDRYGRHTFGQSCLLARRLVERGVRFVTVNSGGWDHHSQIWKGLGDRLPKLDEGLSALLDDLDSRGLMKDTLLAVFGEFGRSPKVNKDIGRDHWGPAASMLFAGAGVVRGQVIGATDKQGGRPTRQPVAPADVACSILEAVGVDPRAALHTPDGRPIEILDSGEPIAGLFA